MESNLNFSATMRWKADSKFVDSPDGKTCSGIEIEELKLDDIVIPLATNTVSAECLVRTRDYGDIQYSAGGIGGQMFLTTASQTEQFRKIRDRK